MHTRAQTHQQPLKKALRDALASQELYGTPGTHPYIHTYTPARARALSHPPAAFEDGVERCRGGARTLRRLGFSVKP